MVTKCKSRSRHPQRYLTIVKPSGSLHPRVQKVGPEHFGIVAVDCAKARSKWMLADFYGRILIPPTVVEHHQQGFDSMIAEIRSAIPSHGLEDVLVAIEPRASIISQLNACSHQTNLTRGSSTP